MCDRWGLLVLLRGGLPLVGQGGQQRVELPHVGQGHKEGQGDQGSGLAQQCCRCCSCCACRCPCCSCRCPWCARAGMHLLRLRVLQAVKPHDAQLSPQAFTGPAGTSPSPSLACV